MAASGALGSVRPKVAKSWVRPSHYFSPIYFSFAVERGLINS